MLVRFSVYMLSLELSEQPAPALASANGQTAVMDPAVIDSTVIDPTVINPATQPAQAACDTESASNFEAEIAAGDLSSEEVIGALDHVAPNLDHLTSAQSSITHSSAISATQSSAVNVISPAAALKSNSAALRANQAKQVRSQHRWRPSTRRLIILACIVLGVRIFIGEASVVPTASMEGTILV